MLAGFFSRKKSENGRASRRHIKGTASITMREIDPTHAKETSFTCLLVIYKKAACSFRMFERSYLQQRRLLAKEGR